MRVAAFLAIEQVLQLNVDYIVPHKPIEVETALLAQALQQKLSPLNFDPLKVVVALVEYIFDCLQGWA